MSHRRDQNYDFERLFIGLAVLALTIRYRHLARWAEYGVLKPGGTQQASYQAVLAPRLCWMSLLDLAWEWFLPGCCPL